MASTPVQPQLIASTGNRSLSNAPLIENPESDQIVVPDAAAIRLEIRGGEWKQAYMQMDGEPWKQPINNEFSTFVEIKRYLFNHL